MRWTGEKIDGRQEGAGMGILRLQEKGMPFTGCLEGEGGRSTDKVLLCLTQG